MGRQHVQVPNTTISNITSEVKQSSKKHYTDLLVYACLKKYMVAESAISLVSLRKISEETELSLTGVQSAIKRLIDNNDIEKIKIANKNQNGYKFNPRSDKFEMYDKEFLDNKELTPYQKAFMIAIQKYLYVDKDTGIAKTTFSTKQLSEKSGLSEKVINERRKELESSGFINRRLTLDKFGNSCEALEFNLPKFGQHVLYKLAEHDEDIKLMKERMIAQEAKIKELTYAVKVLTKNNKSTDTEFEEITI